MARMMIVLCCVTAALVLSGCAGTPPADEGRTEGQAASAEPAETAERPGESPQSTEFPARVGLVRVEDEALRVVREYTRQFYEAELAALHERFSDEFKQSMTLDQLTEMRQSVRDELGEETEVIGEESQQQGDYRGFVRWARFEKYDGVIQVLWILRDDDSIAGFYVRPAQPQG